ncbi:MAG: alpha/beta hydrolase [Bacteroidales bacterium]|nr:alpha/beta hydrolase [Bacteroidales bacterium]
MDNYFNYQDKKIYYRVNGKGNCIVLLHGFLENQNIWNYYSEQMSKSLKVVTIDLPGHGQSENIEEVHSMELMAQIVKELLDRLQITKYVVIGHSMGGYVALAFAEMYSKQTTGFGVFHSHALADSTEAKINRGRAIQVVKENHKNFISSFIPDLFTKENKEIYKKEIEVLQSESRKMEKEGIIAALYGMRQRTDKLKLLQNARVPVLFIIGKKDSRTPMELMNKQIGLPKHSEVLILEHIAHMGFIEAREKCLSFINSFTLNAFSVH